MTKLYTLLCFVLLLASVGQAQSVTLSATSGAASAYDDINAAQFGIEGPDDSSPACASGNASDIGNHKDFGEHILKRADAELGIDVFDFYSHVDEDSDRCTKLGADIDRIRIEIKGGPTGDSRPEIEHTYGTESFYRWQFRLPADFQGSSSFTHLFQSKTTGGPEDDNPVLTLTARTSRVELVYGASNVSGDNAAIASAPLSGFLGQWVEVYVRQVHADDGELEVTIRDVATGVTLLAYGNADIDLWREVSRDPSIINRPKWGIYRKTTDNAGNPLGLKDEIVSFGTFCVSESATEVCPAMAAELNGGAAPSAVTDALPLDGSENVPLSMPLVWDGDPATTSSYNVYFGTSPTPPLVGASLAESFQPTLAANTTYYFQIGAVNGGQEVRNAVQSFKTLVDPDDGTWEVARGHAAPQVETPFFTLTANATGPVTNRVERIGGPGTGNNAFAYVSETAGDGANNYKYANAIDGTQPATVVIRLSTVPETNNITYVEFVGFGLNEKIRINSSSLRIERAGNAQKSFPAGFWSGGAYNTIRITFEREGTALRSRVYLNESTTAFDTGLSTVGSTSSPKVEVGRAASTTFGASFDYLAVDNSGAFAPGQGSALPRDLLGLAPLPLTWLDGPKVGGDDDERTITWTVANQVNTSHFVVEARPDDQEQWVAVATLAADGDLAAARQFVARDGRRVSGAVYYRVKQLDLDGSYDYSAVAVYSPRDQASDLRVFPSPSSGEVWISGGDTASEVSVANVTGQRLISVAMGAGPTALDLSALPAGTYFVTVRDAAGVRQTQRLLLR